MNDIDKAINLLRSEGYSVSTRTGFEPGVVYLIRFHKNDGGVSYNVRLHKKGMKDSYYGDRSEIARIELDRLTFEPMDKLEKQS